MKKRIFADELEMSINYKAIRASWVFSTIYLVIWNIVVVFKTGKIETLAFVLMCLQDLILWLVKSILTRKMVSGCEDEE
ncbi:MAG: hypothetical protein ACOX1F_02820 [Erysipelotrichaceae bacterium]|jgi:hypothetical protein